MGVNVLTLNKYMIMHDMTQAHTLILEWGGSCSQQMDHNGVGDL